MIMFLVFFHDVKILKVGHNISELIIRRERKLEYTLKNAYAMRCSKPQKQLDYRTCDKTCNTVKTLLSGHLVNGHPHETASN